MIDICWESETFMRGCVSGCARVFGGLCVCACVRCCGNQAVEKSGKHDNMSSWTSNAHINSIVMAASVVNTSITDLTEPLHLTFTHINNVSSFSNLSSCSSRLSVCLPAFSRVLLAVGFVTSSLRPFLCSSVFLFFAFYQSAWLVYLFAICHTGLSVFLSLRDVHLVLQWSGNRNCVFWQADDKSGEWSSRGCKVLTDLSSDNYTTCACDHMTNFALLMVSPAATVNTNIQVIVLTVGSLVTREHCPNPRANTLSGSIPTWRSLPVPPVEQLCSGSLVLWRVLGGKAAKSMRWTREKLVLRKVRTRTDNLQVSGEHLYYLLLNVMSACMYDAFNVCHY